MPYQIVLLLLAFLTFSATTSAFQEKPPEKITKTYKPLTVTVEPAAAEFSAEKQKEYAEYWPLFLKELESQAGNFDQGCGWLINLSLLKKPSGSCVVSVTLEQKFTQDERSAAARGGVNIQPSERTFALATKERFGDGFLEMIKSDIAKIAGYCQCKKF